MTANPLLYQGTVEPDAETFPPTISIVEPRNNSELSKNHLKLVFNVKAPESKTASSTYIYKVSYSADWMEKPITLYNRWADLGNGIKNSDFTLEFSNMSDGLHSIMIEAMGMGWYVQQGTSRDFYNRQTSMFNFSIDTTVPVISVILNENKTYLTSEVPLTIIINEQSQNISYTLDGNKNVYIAGNTTIRGLSNGSHNITIFANDAAGNIGTSIIEHFTVDLTMPTEFISLIPLVSTGIAISIIVFAGLLIYWKKGRNKINLKKAL